MANDLAVFTNSLNYFGSELLYQLKSRLALVNLISRRDFSGQSTAKGATVQINTMTVSGDSRTRAINGAVVADDLASTSTLLTAQQIYKAIKIDNLEVTFGSTNLMDQAASQLAMKLARGVDSTIINTWTKIPYQTGKTDGTAAINATDKLNVLAKARQLIAANEGPDMDLKAVLGLQEAYNFRTLDTFHKVNEAGTTTGRIDGSLGRILGFDLYESQRTPTATLATTAEWGTPLVNAAGGYAIGVTSIAVDGLAATAAIEAGSIFTVGGYAYTVAADVTAVAGAATFTLNTPLKSVLVDNQAITFTAHSAASGIGIAFHPDAFLFFSRPAAPFPPGSGVVSTTIGDPETDLSLRLSIESKLVGGAGDGMSIALAADIICGAGLVRPELAVRIAGQV